ncbi:MAG: hypothetical protein AB7O59_22365 [Pirellulales bacterium]
MTDDFLQELKEALTEGHKQSAQAADEALPSLFQRIIIEINGDGVAADMLADKLRRYAAIAANKKRAK